MSFASGLTDVIRAFVDGCRRLMAVWFLVVALIALCLITSSPAIDDLNTLVSRNFVRQQFIATFQTDPVSLGHILPYVGTWPFYLAGWMFLLGGLLDSLVHRRLSQLGVFVRSCTRYCFRFVRLLLIEVCVKGLLLLLAIALAGPGLDGSISAMRPFFLCLSVLLMGMTTVVFTYAAIRTITEERLSVIGSTIAAARFVNRRIGSVAILSLLNVGVFAIGTIVSIVFVRPQTISDVPTFFSFLFIAQLVTVLTSYASALSYFDAQVMQPKNHAIIK
jgi:hypothetical protein